jgi:hypothetical protein
MEFPRMAGKPAILAALREALSWQVSVSIALKATNTWKMAGDTNVSSAPLRGPCATGASLAAFVVR